MLDVLQDAQARDRVEFGGPRQLLDANDGSGVWRCVINADGEVVASIRRAEEALLQGSAIGEFGTVRIGGFACADAGSSMPFKANTARRHHIPTQKRRVLNWADYDASLR